MKDKFDISIKTRVKIKNLKTGEVILDKSNAIHSINMSRIIARGLANELNSGIFRIAFGNGGTFTDPTGNLILKKPNVDEWQSRLYNETYSEIVKIGDVNFGQDPGSAEPGNIRTGGGAAPEYDPPGTGVSSTEIGERSEVKIMVALNENEPSGQYLTVNDFGSVIDASEREFIFDEIGLYSPGLPASDTSGKTSINVGNKISDDIITNMTPNSVYVFNYKIDGVSYSTTITTPNAGSGPSGEFTYGDLCEGLNTNSWVTAGDDFNSYAYIFITDRNQSGAYTTIEGKQSYGLITIYSLTSGTTSSAEVICDSSNSNDLVNLLTNGVCALANVKKVNGLNAGLANNPTDRTLERERLLTHIIFPPITKTADTSYGIEYTLGIAVIPSNDSSSIVSNPPPPPAY